MAQGLGHRDTAQTAMTIPGWKRLPSSIAHRQCLLHKLHLQIAGADVIRQVALPPTNQIPTRFALPCFPPLHVCTHFWHTPEETDPASNCTSHAAVSVWSRCHKRRECTKQSALCQLLDCSCIAAHPVNTLEHSVHLLYSSSLSWISRYHGKGTSYPLLPLDRITKVHACV